MKDKIKEIFDSELFVCMEKDICGLQRAADQLTALMCYREVRAYCAYDSQFWADDDIPHYVIQDCVNYLKEDYPEGLIREAIEQVKNEQK